MKAILCADDPAFRPYIRQHGGEQVRAGDWLVPIGARAALARVATFLDQEVVELDDAGRIVPVPGRYRLKSVERREPGR